MIRMIETSVVESNYEQVKELDGTNYTMRFLWNERDNHWYMTLKDSEGTDIVTGIKVVADAPFSVNNVLTDFPPGQIWFIDMTGTSPTPDPGLRELGARVRLFYIDEDSLT
jgi:hypothetical protein